MNGQAGKKEFGIKEFGIKGKPVFVVWRSITDIRRIPMIEKGGSYGKAQKKKSK